MGIITFNILWMIYNSLLALLPVLFAVIAFKQKRSFPLRLLFFFLWLLFLPNTTYLLTDITHFFNQSYLVPFQYLFLLIFEYTLLFSVGIFTFFASLYLFEQYIHRHSHNKVWTPVIAVFAVNFLISIGIMMGRIQRTNSWDIFANPVRVLSDLSYVVQTQSILLFIFPFWILLTALYYILKRMAG